MQANCSRAQLYKSASCYRYRQTLRAKRCPTSKRSAQPDVSVGSIRGRGGAMDYESRISRVEAQVEMNQRDIERLYQAISELRSLMLERFDQIDQRFIEERKYLDQRFVEERKQTDLSIGGLQTQINGLQAQINELRAQIGVLQAQISGLQAQMGGLQDQLSEFRREVGMNMRWIMGMWLTTISMVLGLGAKVFGIY